MIIAHLTPFALEALVESNFNHATRDGVAVPRFVSEVICHSRLAVLITATNYNVTDVQGTYARGRAHLPDTQHHLPGYSWISPLCTI